MTSVSGPVCPVSTRSHTILSSDAAAVVADASPAAPAAIASAIPAPSSLPRRHSRTEKSGSAAVPLPPLATSCPSDVSSGVGRMRSSGGLPPWPPSCAASAPDVAPYAKSCGTCSKAQSISSSGCTYSSEDACTTPAGSPGGASGVDATMSPLVGSSSFAVPSSHVVSSSRKPERGSTDSSGRVGAVAASSGCSSGVAWRSSPWRAPHSSSCPSQWRAVRRPCAASQHTECSAAAVGSSCPSGLTSGCSRSASRSAEPSCSCGSSAVEQTMALPPSATKARRACSSPRVGSDAKSDAVNTGFCSGRSSKSSCRCRAARMASPSLAALSTIGVMTSFSRKSFSCRCSAVPFLRSSAAFLLSP